MKKIFCLLLFVVSFIAVMAQSNWCYQMVHGEKFL